MAKKSFSLLMAFRYLNPIRTNVSVISMISLLGVAAGVMVLVVSLSVMNGFERLLKDIVLTSRPHIYLEHRSLSDAAVPPITEDIWSRSIEELEKLDFIDSVSPRIGDFVGLQIGEHISPRQMIGVDTNNQDELKKLQNNLIEKQGGDAYALEQGDKALISSKLQDETGLQVGSTVLIHSSSNIKKIIPEYERLDEPSLNEIQEENIAHIISSLSDPQQWVISDQGEEASADFIRGIANDFVLFFIEYEGLRPAEDRVLESIFAEFKTKISIDEETDRILYPLGTKAQLIEKFKLLQDLDKDEMDSAALRELKEIILPKEVVIVGVLQTNNFASISDIYIPFGVAQDLVDLDGGIQGLSVSVSDHSQVNLYKEELLSNRDLKIGKDREAYSRDFSLEWAAITWTENSAELFKIMEMQKFMMVFVLSFIVLVAVFSIAAVMFTVAIQKKQEIGVMKALGATPMQIINVFAYQGIFVGFLGAALGLGVGLLIVLNISTLQQFIREQLHYNPFPQSLYGTETMPTHIIPMEFTIVGVGALLLCTLASLLPAWSASRTDAARSLRNL